jgi:hypothetical protein
MKNLNPAPNSNTQKEPKEWVSGDDPMTGAQASYLKTIEWGKNNHSPLAACGISTTKKIPDHWRAA